MTTEDDMSSIEESQPQNAKLTEENIKKLQKGIERGIFKHLKKIPERNYFLAIELSGILWTEERILISTIPDGLGKSVIDRLKEKEFILCNKVINATQVFRGNKFSEWEKEISL